MLKTLICLFFKINIHNRKDDGCFGQSYNLWILPLKRREAIKWQLTLYACMCVCVCHKPLWKLATAAVIIWTQMFLNFYFFLKTVSHANWQLFDVPHTSPLSRALTLARSCLLLSTGSVASNTAVKKFTFELRRFVKIVTSLSSLAVLY